MQADCTGVAAPVNFLARMRPKGYPVSMAKPPKYVLDDQIGYVLRRVTQRHLSLFSEAIPEVTTTQFAVMARLAELGPLSQNHLGRETAMDAATIKGVVDRLARQGLVETTPDLEDRRRLTVGLTTAGAALFAQRVPTALAISAKTLDPLGADEQRQLLALLARLA
jgi:DNA-binding MarR family transcriptional regulator